MGLGVDEFCDACIQFSRKNYADLMPDGSTKKVGNTIKSRKMSGYLETFIDEGINMLLHGQGDKFLNAYYDYIEKIYNYQIPIRDIASKGNIKKTIEEYKADCKTLTKAGSKKSRQAWYELVIQNNVKVNVSDTIYYINTGTKKGHSDVKRITHYYVFGVDGSKNEITKEVEKLYKEQESGKKTRFEVAKEHWSGSKVTEEDEIILNCKMVPQEIIDTDDVVLCSDVEDMEYNVEKYIDMFNKRITPLLVCFSKDIRNNILITDPKDRKFFTSEESRLVSGEPNKEGDQDTYEALMTPERKELEFWTKVGEVPPFVEECGIAWDELVKEFEQEKEEENNELFISENEKYLKILDELTDDDYDAFINDGKIPTKILAMMTLGTDMKLYFKKIPNKTPTSGGFIFEDLVRNDEIDKDGE